MSDMDIAWAAGFVDGEGSVCIYRKGKYYYLSLSEYHTTAWV